MIILVEGPDCAGKTTYCNWLIEQHGYRSVHYGTFECNPLPNYLELLNSLDRYDDVVIDRMWISEYVYGHALRGGERLGAKVRMLERAFTTLGGVTVMVRTPKSVIQERLFTEPLRDEMNGVRDHWEKIWSLYYSYVPNTPYVEWAGVDHSRMWSPYDLCDLQAKSIRGVHGNGKGRFLIIGESLNPSNGNKFTFCSSVGCSPWLCDQLDKSGVPETEIGWANQDTLTKGAIVDMEPEYVYALGAKARNWCEKNDVSATMFDHPQYWKRFKSNGDYPLVEAMTADWKLINE